MYDILLGIYIVGLMFWPDPFQKKIFFNFWPIVLLMSTFALREVRQFRSLFLFLFGLWSLGLVFTHSQIASPHQLNMKYMNVYLLTDGFIYILSACLVFYLSVKYVKSHRLFLYLAPIFFYKMLFSAMDYGKMTFVFSFFVALFLYGIIRKKYRFCMVTFLIAFILLLIPIPHPTYKHLYQWLAMKWVVRPWVWFELARQIYEHPIVGNGFGRELLNDNMVWVRQVHNALFAKTPIGQVEYGWVLKQNDYLNLGSYTGIPGLLLIIGFITEMFLRIKNNPIVIVFLTFAVASFFQCVVFDVYRGGIVAIVIAMVVAEVYEHPKIAVL